MAALLQQLGELQRRLDNLLRFGTVTELDHKAARARVQCAGNLTAWLRWFAPAAGQDDTEWRPPSLGEQVMILSPSGELRAGVILSGLYSDQAPANGDAAGLFRRTFANGDVLEYQNGNAVVQVSGSLNATAASVDLQADSISLQAGSISLQGDAIELVGPVTQTGGDMTSDGISAQNHTHIETGSETQKPKP